VLTHLVLHPHCSHRTVGTSNCCLAGNAGWVLLCVLPLLPAAVDVGVVGFITPVCHWHCHCGSVCATEHLHAQLPGVTRSGTQLTCTGRDFTRVIPAPTHVPANQLYKDGTVSRAAALLPTGRGHASLWGQHPLLVDTEKPRCSFHRTVDCRSQTCNVSVCHG
jgi:hypothetical protein